MTTILDFDASSPLLGTFEQWPAVLYHGDPYYRSTAVVRLSGLGVRYFLAMQGSTVAGRVAAITNPAISWNAQPTGLLGFYECVDVSGVSRVLLGAALEHLRERGCRCCLGPMNGSTWRSYRLTEPSAEPPFLLDNYHKPWYAAQFREAGFLAASTYRSTRIPLHAPVHGRVERFAGVFAARGIAERGIDLDAYDREITAIHELSLRAFAGNVLYAPIPREEFLELYRPARALADPAFVRICTGAAGEALAFIFCVPDLFDRARRTLVIKTVATLPQPRARGLGTFLVEKIHAAAHERGFTHVIHALMHDDNVSTRISSDGAEVIHRYTLYGVTL